MQLRKEDARAAVEIGSLALGSLAVAFPRLAARVYGYDPNAGATTVATRSIGARNIAFGTLLLHVDDGGDEEERYLLAAAAVGAFDCLAGIAAAAKKKQKWYGTFVQFATAGTLAAMASYALTQ